MQRLREPQACSQGAHNLVNTRMYPIVDLQQMFEVQTQIAGSLLTADGATQK